MQKLATIGLALLVLVLGVLGGAGSAQASPGTRTFKLTVNHASLSSGEVLVVTAKSSGPCAWLLEWNGERRVLRGAKTFRASFTAPAVDDATPLPLRATCFYSAKQPPLVKPGSDGPAVPDRRDSQAIVVFVPPSWHGVAPVTVLPAGIVSPPTIHPHHPGPAGLPNTGGPGLWLLLAGLTSLLLGAAAVRVSGSGTAASS